MNRVYAVDGSAEFNERLDRELARLAAEVEAAFGRNLVALVLGGGYGRGEGGVALVSGKETPYNDLDLTLVVRHKQAVPTDKLLKIGERYANQLKIHVDFSRPLTLRDIEHWPRCLMWYDLLAGHIVLKGSPEVLVRHAPRDLTEPLPLIEATRLLLNRGAGLLWALRVVRGVEAGPDRDFVRRNYYKCALALGDALLIAYRCYTSAYHGRAKLFSSLQQDHPRVASFHLDSLYGEALRFKFKPSQLPAEGFDENSLIQLAKQWGAVFLHIESLRTGSRWDSFSDYAGWRGVREKDQHHPRQLLRNLVRNGEMGRLSLRYPREELYRKLPVLLGLDGDQPPDWNGESASFLKVWNRFN